MVNRIYSDFERIIIDEMIDMGLNPTDQADVMKYWENKLPEVEKDVCRNLH